MKRQSTLAVIVLAVLSGLWTAYGERSTDSADVPPGGSSDARIEQAFKDRQGDLQIEGEGTVVHILPDDTKGSQHQRFLLELDSGLTLLVAHNIDLAPRIPDLQRGDRVRFNGEYEWNDKGGVIHWTHHAPRGDHVDGWLERDGQRYE